MGKLQTSIIWVMGTAAAAAPGLGAVMLMIECKKVKGTTELVKGCTKSIREYNSKMDMSVSLYEHLPLHLQSQADSSADRGAQCDSRRFLYAVREASNKIPASHKRKSNSGFG